METMTQTKTQPSQPSQIMPVERLCKLLGLPDDIEPDDGGWAYKAGYDEEYEETYKVAIEDGEPADEAEKMADAAGATAGELSEQAAMDEAWWQHRSAIESSAETAFGWVNLELDFRKDGTVKVEPETTWGAAAHAIKEVINGDGICGHFDTLKEWLDSGPWTPRQAVLAHLGWIKRYADVYGESSPSKLYERHLR